jgi:hypothetical protein
VECRKVRWSLDFGHCRVRIVRWLQSLSDARVENAIIDRATNLKEQVGAPPRLSHLFLLFIHSSSGTWPLFRWPGSNSQSGTVLIGVID